MFDSGLVLCWEDDVEATQTPRLRRQERKRRGDRRRDSIRKGIREIREGFSDVVFDSQRDLRGRFEIYGLVHEGFERLRSRLGGDWSFPWGRTAAGNGGEGGDIQ